MSEERIDVASVQQRWEYRCECLKALDRLEVFLNEIGDERWELVSMSQAMPICSLCSSDRNRDSGATGNRDLSLMGRRFQTGLDDQGRITARSESGPTCGCHFERFRQVLSTIQTERVIFSYQLPA